MRLYAILTVLVTAGSGRALAAQGGMYRLEQLRSVPDGWAVSGVPNPQQRFQLRIALHQQNVAQFEQTLLDISTPGHEKYGKHLSRKAIKAILRPAEETINGVLQWLKNEGIHEFVEDGDWIHLNLTVRQAEKLLGTKFNLYRNSVNGLQRLRTLGYSVPAILRGHIDMIQPTIRFEQIRAEASTILGFTYTGKADRMLKTTTVRGASFDFATCNVSDNIHLYITEKSPMVTPECLRHLYSIPDAEPVLKAVHSKFGICGYLDLYAQYADLAIFTEEYAPYAVSGNFSVTLVNNGRNDQNTTMKTLEANLDTQYGVSLSFPVPVEYYSTGGMGELVPDLDTPINLNEPYLDFLHFILSLPDSQLPQTLSTSYGEDEQSVPEPYTQSTCNLFAQLGARGVSVIFSSGDWGVGRGCMTNDGKNTTRFLPQFPAACPFVTSVGATFGVLPEQATFFSSGGFSDRFPRPSYQDAAVASYLSRLGDQWKGLYNPDGRGFPDVSAQGMYVSIIDKDKEAPVYGTSASAPIFASIVALLNTNRLENNLPPLGFLNPWLYGVGKAGLTDIVDGGSNGCTANDTGTAVATPFVPFASWNATPGWDPVTGLGTPNYPRMQSALPSEQQFISDRMPPQPY